MLPNKQWPIRSCRSEVWFTAEQLILSWLTNRNRTLVLQSPPEALTVCLELSITTVSHDDTPQILVTKMKICTYISITSALIDQNYLSGLFFASVIDFSLVHYTGRRALWLCTGSLTAGSNTQKQACGTWYDYSWTTEVTWNVLTVFLVTFLDFQRPLQFIDDEGALRLHLKYLNLCKWTKDSGLVGHKVQLYQKCQFMVN